MNEADAQRLIDKAFAYPRRWRSETLGRIQNYSADEMRVLGLRTIKPSDVTAEQLAETRKERKNERRRLRRLRQGKQTREQYLASFTQSNAQTRPWIAEGISRRAWYYRRSKERIAPGVVPMRLIIEGHNPVQSQ
jgi:hypothetical protein